LREKQNARIIPSYDSVAVPLEAAQILWQSREYDVTDVSLKTLDKARTIQHTAKGMNGNFREDPERISAPR
jgi:hypothetical protein